jgi:hypothetical protein
MDAVASISPPKGMSPARFESRDKFYRKLVAQSPIGEFGSDYQKASLLRSMDTRTGCCPHRRQRRSI